MNEVLLLVMVMGLVLSVDLVGSWWSKACVTRSYKAVSSCSTSVALG